MAVQGIAVEPPGSPAFHGPMIAAVRQYPLAALAAGGILLGAGFHLLDPRTARWVFAAVATIGGVPLVLQTARNMASGRFHVDTIASVSIVTSVLLGEYLAGALVVLMQSGGEALEDYGLRRANRSLDNLLRRAPSIARVRRDGSYQDVPAGEVQAGDALLIRPGDIIAVDGIVIDGEAEVDESALTGEPVPLPKLPGDQVFSGTINLAGTLHVKATNTAAKSKYELIVRMVQQAQGERAPINRLANRYTPPFTLFTMAAAAAVYFVTGESSRALSVLVVATPCPLIIATPLAVLSAINRAASLNIIVKSGAAIEETGVVDAVVFDKTGTLTIGTPSLAEIRPVGAISVDELLESCAAVELHSPHVLATSVVHAARKAGLRVTPAADFTQSPGVGVAGVMDGTRVAIGSVKYLESLGIGVTERIRDERSRLGAEGKTVALVGVDDRVEGMLVFEDRIRSESLHLMGSLKELGIGRVVMLTGDAPETAKAVASQIGIGEVRARLHPEDKVESVRELAAGQTVMMVGDGINDAPALAAADVGVAMGSFGAGIATDAADIVITVENVERVADVIQIGRRMVRIAKQGILFGIGASFVLMGAAAFGLFSPAVGALLQEAIDLAAILNALRSQ